MLMMVRWLLRVFKKEHDLLVRYERSHPHFFWFLSLDALLSVALVVGGYQIFLNNSSSAEIKEPGEITLISSGALTSQSAAEKMDAFWLGPLSDAKYTINDHDVGIVDIFYVPNTSTRFDDKTYLYEVKTYARQDVWDTHTHPIKSIADTTTFSIDKNVSIRINKSSMRGVIATFTDKPEIVAIGYTKPQTLESMIKNVESLKLVS